MRQKWIPRSCGTHDNTFHADEVSACALLCLFDLIDQDKILRTRDIEKLKTCEYICDVGGVYDSKQKWFDHHQVDYQGTLSSAGMVLLYLKEEGLITDNVYTFFNEAIIRGVDDHDNGKDPQIPGWCSYSHVVSNFTPIEREVSPETQDAAFFQALEFAYGHFKRLWERYQYNQSCRQTLVKAMESKEECLVFEENIPWLDLFFELNGEAHPAKFIIMPSGNHWKLRGIPPNYQDKMNVRFPLPSKWAGLLEEDLKKASGIPGAIFCHKGRFISVWETREDAFQALKYTLEHKDQEDQ